MLASKPFKRYHLQRRSPHMDQHSSNGQPRKDMEEQNQLPYQVQALQIMGRLHPHLRACELENFGGDRENGSKHSRTNVWESPPPLGWQVSLVTIIKQWMMAWFGRVTRHGSLCKDIMQDTFEGERNWGHRHKNWSENIKEWKDVTMPQLLTDTANRSFCFFCPQDAKKIKAV